MLIVETKGFSFKRICEDWGCGSAVECSPSLHKPWGVCDLCPAYRLHSGSQEFEPALCSYQLCMQKQFVNSQKCTVGIVVHFLNGLWSFPHGACRALHWQTRYRNWLCRRWYYWHENKRRLSEKSQTSVRRLWLLFFQVAKRILLTVAVGLSGEGTH